MRRVRRSYHVRWAVPHVLQTAFCAPAEGDDPRARIAEDPDHGAAGREAGEALRVTELAPRGVSKNHARTSPHSPHRARFDFPMTSGLASEQNDSILTTRIDEEPEKRDVNRYVPHNCTDDWRHLGLSHKDRCDIPPILSSTSYFPENRLTS